MNVVEIIRKKRDGLENSPQEIRELIRGVVDESVAGYQIGAWLMAVFLNGMSVDEGRVLTEALIHSGQVVDLSDVDGFKVDKHSTGGVGDKTSLVIAPIVAAAGVPVPMISGRGLGHTGGTLDKLESITGFRVDLSLDQFRAQVKKIGVSLIGQTEEITPGDRHLYALRDVTATVESVPLIVSSIISKKIAEGIDGLVLDVKTGSGAFMKSFEDSERLAVALVEAGRALDKKVTALITDMSQPLGRRVGNALEVVECLETLQGRGPEDLTQLCLELSAHMLEMALPGLDLDSARHLARKQIEEGRALEKFRQIVEAQQGDSRLLSDTSRFPRSRHVYELKSSRSGFLREARADRIGRAAMLLGAGRQTLDSRINPAVGIELMVKVGDPVDRGQELSRVHYDEEALLDQALGELEPAFQVGPDRIAPTPLVRKVIA